MEKAVTVMTQLNSLVTQCDGYVQGRFDCPDISQPELYAKWEFMYSGGDKVTDVAVVFCNGFCALMLTICWFLFQY